MRFTPTPVGNTSLWVAKKKLPSVHPHACGEYATKQRQQHHNRGSPPRLWGIRKKSNISSLRKRFTPTPVGNTKCSACAATPPRFTPTPVGNTRGHSLEAVAISVHPHACGEYPRLCPPCCFGDGSPPRLWGIPPTTAPFPLHCRFTPTPVGNTSVVGLS